ncbi:FUSC family protein [Mycetohabitans sp. B5]|uniref:Putative membrane protein YccC n=1 Tax=Mycetohabitans endofungorum TaxID=417203 RepID=A0A2P5K7W8_9BURK|nr:MULTISPECIES: FUSC family protein [Mycetohabitans]MCG1054274.1 FUSC family protein [Mycetohabitans sp. B5]PPB82811.1 putative membrane protein YccC [Mycetohabitans endofungorum]
MSSATSALARLTSSSAWRDTVRDWLRTDGRVWIYIFKTVGAALLALGVAMKLDLPQPRTAMTTVFIVMQPQSGMVLAKSFYRIVGTVVGSVVTIALVSLFAQQRELFLLSVSVWVGVCTFGAARNRNFRSYGFVLAGYTAALVGIPAAQHADGAFMAAVTRVTEVTLGILCAGTVSALVLPQHTADAIRATVRARYLAFVEFVSDTLAGRIDRSRAARTNARFAADVVGLEAMRSFAVFEDPRSRMRSGRLSRLNTEFMNASTRFHALHQLMNRIRAGGQVQVVEAIEPYFREVAPLMLKKSGEPVRNAEDAQHAATQLQAFKQTLPRRIRDTRAQLEQREGIALLDFDTAAELLYRFVDEMHAYALTYASLSTDLHEREHDAQRYIPRTHTVAAGVAGVRAAIVMLLFAAFWIGTAWPSGGMAVLNAAATSALVASMPQPAKSAAQMAMGTIIAVLAGFIAVFGIFPHLDGYALLCATLAPLLMFGVLMSTRAGWAAFGMGYCVFFCFLAGPDNVVRYDPSSYLNDAIALIAAMLVVALVSAVLLPPASPWLHKQLQRALLHQVVDACDARLSRARQYLESGTRDLLHQANAVTADRPDLQMRMLSWTFTVLEVGHAVIELRTELDQLPADPRYSANMPWRQAAQHMLNTLAALFSAPSHRRLVDAREATAASIDATLVMLRSVAGLRDDRHRLQRTLSYLHFIRTALLDTQSPLSELTPGPHGPHRRDTTHAA